MVCCLLLARLLTALNEAVRGALRRRDRRLSTTTETSSGGFPL